MSGISPQKPVSLWQRPLKVNFGALAAALAKGTAAGVFMQWSDLAGSGVDVLGSLGIQGNEVEAIAWLLVERCLLQAMVELTGECKTSLNTPNPQLKLLCDQLEHSLQTSDLSLTPDFFDRPKQLPVLEQVKEPYRLWLRSNGLSAEQAASLKERLPQYFVFALYNEWLSCPAKYDLLKESLSDNPFRAATERELAWRRYGAWLQREVDKPVFAEAFSLRQIYQPLGAYYEFKVKEFIVKSKKVNGFESGRLRRENDKYLRHLVDLQTAITDWLTANDRTDTIRVVCGGPGCGKSSFGRWLAANMLEKPVFSGKPFRVMFIPLHQFNPLAILPDAINELINDDFEGVLPPNPLEKDTAEFPVLLIFDGLDEMAMMGKEAAEVAKAFVRDKLLKKMQSYNKSEARVFALLMSRESLTKAIERDVKEDQILHILSYLPYYQAKRETRNCHYKDEYDLLEKDQRQDWWKAYGKLKGKSYQGLPQELNRDKLVEITAQPLLNYLVALSYDRGEVDFSKESNINAIYYDLIDQVYQRKWDVNQKHPALQDLSEEEFILILEEIAVSCWHGNERTTTIDYIIERFSEDQRRILEAIKESIKEGMTRLLIAFYFRQGDTKDSKSAFEFTHKSFGEYLTARRIVRGIKLIQQKRKDLDDCWDEKECLRQWVMLCGPRAMDKDLCSFLEDEVKLHPEEASQWQQTLCDLIGYMLRQGMPMEELEQNYKFIEEVRQARNASESLLVMLSSCARVTKNISNIDYPTPEALGSWLSTLQGQRRNGEEPLAFHHLNYLNISQCDLSLSNLSGAIFSEANLSNANLFWANLVDTIFEKANLPGVNLDRATLNGAYLMGANLDDASLNDANLDEVNLSDASLKRTSTGWQKRAYH